MKFALTWLSGVFFMGAIVAPLDQHDSGVALALLTSCIAYAAAAAELGKRQ
jgi:hypothetical protein